MLSSLVKRNLELQTFLVSVFDTTCRSITNASYIPSGRML